MQLQHPHVAPMLSIVAKRRQRDARYRGAVPRQFDSQEIHPNSFPDATSCGEEAPGIRPRCSAWSSPPPAGADG